MTIEAMMEEIRILPIEERKRLIGFIQHTLTQDVQQPTNQKHSLQELRGLGKEIWQGLDAQEYVNQLRNEWDEPK